MYFKQSNNEKLIPAYIRFLKLLHDYPSHNLPNWLLLDIFYGGLDPSSKTDLDAASHGSFSNTSLEEAWHLLDIMHTNFIQWHDNTVHEEKLLPTDLENVVDEFLKIRVAEEKFLMVIP